MYFRHFVPGIALFLVSMSSTPVLAADPDQAAISLSDGVLNGIQSGNGRATLEKALPVVRASKPTEFDNLVRQTESALELFGPMRKWELASSETIGTLVVKRVYVSQHEKAPLFWTLIAYRAPSGWQITYFYFDDKVTEHF